MYYGASVCEYKPFLLLGSAHAVVIHAALLFVVHFPVIKYKYVVFVFLTSSMEVW